MAFNAEKAICRIYSTSSIHQNFKRGPKTTIFYDKKCFSYRALNTSSLIFQSTTDPEENDMYPAYSDRDEESVVILGALDFASSFVINAVAGALSTVDEYVNTVIANQNDAKFGQELYFNTQDDIDANGYRAAVCRLASDLVLHCSTGHNRTIMFDDGGVVALASPIDAAGYPLLALTAIC